MSRRRLPRMLRTAVALTLLAAMAWLLLFQGDNKPAPDDVTPSRADLVAKPVLDLTGAPTHSR